MNEPLFRVSNLSFAWPEQDPLLKDISLAIGSREKILLRGETGSGKSTLLQLLLGLLKPRSGAVFIQEKPVGKLAAATFRQIWFSRQGMREDLFGLSPLHDLQIWQMAYPELLTPQALASLKDPLTAKWETPWSALSAGEMRAFSLLLLPFFTDKFWILDEPTTSLDAARKEAFLELCREKRPAGMLIVSHDSALPESLFDRILLLQDGTIRETSL